MRKGPSGGHRGWNNPGPSRKPLWAALVLLGLGPGPILAQNTGVIEGVSLDSLLSLPVSTAAKYEQRQTEAPAFVTIVTREEIERFGYRTLEEALREQTGFYSGSDREYSDLGFRGIGRPGYFNNKILLMVDGHSVNDAFTGGARMGSAMPVDMNAVERIEIVRGPGSSIHGARAMLAVVNLVTRSGRSLDGWEGMGELGTRGAKGGSVSYGKILSPDRDLALSASVGSEDGDDVFFPEFDAAIMNHGVAEELDWTRNFRGLATARLGEVFLQGSAARRDHGSPTGAYRSTFNEPGAETRDESLFFEARYSRNLGTATELTFRGYGDAYGNRATYPQSGVIVASGESKDTVSEGDLVARMSAASVGGEFRLRWDPASNQRVMAGIEAQRVMTATHRLSGPRFDPIRVKAPYSIVSGYFHQEFQVTPGLSLTFGIRRDEYSTQGSATTPRGALVYHLSPASSLKVLAGEAFRAPNLQELYVFNPAAALLGNPELEPEKVRSLEAVWEQRIGPVSTVVSAFHNEVRGLIDWVQVEAPDSLQLFGRFAYKQQNIASARAQGFELEGRASLPFGILARAGYGFSNAIDQDTKDRLVNSPRHLFRFSAFGGSDRIGHLSLSLRRDGARQTLYGTDTSPVTVLDVTASSRRLFDRLQAQLIVKNLLDTEYSVPGGFQHVQASIPQQRRTVNLRVTVKW